MRNYAKEMQIDPEALDLEWLNHANLEVKYIDQLSELRKEVKDAEEEVKTVRSELVREAHENPQECCNSKKATGPQVEAYYRTHQDYKNAKKECIDAQDAYEVARDIKDAIHFTRTKSLENLVKLHAAQYFAGPKVPGDLATKQKDFLGLEKLKEQRGAQRNKRTGKGMVRRK